MGCPLSMECIVKDLLLVDDEFRHIGAGIVAAGVELHAGAGGLIGVNVGVDDVTQLAVVLAQSKPSFTNPGMGRADV